MARFLAIRWNGRSLRFVCADADRGGRLTLVDAGQRLPTDAQTATAAVDLLRQIVQETKCEKQRLLILLGRGAIESTTFDVPPATEDELPLLVRNLAQQNIAGLSEDGPLDFIAYPLRADGSRTVSALSIMSEEQASVRQLREQCGCRNVSILVAPHSLRAFAAASATDTEDAQSVASGWDGLTPVETTLLVARGDEQADVLVSTATLPLLSRTIRLPNALPQGEAAQFLIGETQRTLISAGGHLAQRTRISRVVLIGSSEATRGLAETFTNHYQAPAEHAEVLSLLAGEPVELSEGNPDSADYAALLGAISEAARGLRPAVDFAAPKRPQPPRSSHGRWLAALVAVLLVVGGGTSYVWSQFGELDSENARLAVRLQELNELIKDTEARRALITAMTTWEKNRFSWPDELLDITTRMPARPGITVQQLSVSAAGPGTSVATFSGIGKPPELIAQMERALRDSRHDIRIPAIREQLVGKELQGSFQATLTIRNAGPAEPAAKAGVTP
jgi:Tfp pilus assembly protein PilN